MANNPTYNKNHLKCRMDLWVVLLVVFKCLHTWILWEWWAGKQKNRLQDMIAAAAEDPQESYEQLLGLSVVAACATRGLKVPGMW